MLALRSTTAIKILPGGFENGTMHSEERTRLDDSVMAMNKLNKSMKQKEKIST